MVDVFGDGLRVVVYCQGQDVLENFKQYAPKYYRNLKAMDKTLGGSLDNPTSSSLRRKPHVTIQVLVHNLYLFVTDGTHLLHLQRTLYSQQKNS